MRTLTVTRQKSFVASLAKDLVYLEDPVAPELTINGVPCRKLGELKNGETASFEIDGESRQLFLIADKLSKEYCNASVAVPAGDEPVAFSGKHHFVFGSNPFRFDGVEQTPEKKRQQKKKGTVGFVIMVAAIVVGLLAGKALGGLLVPGSGDPMAAAPKSFTRSDFSITLTEAFTETEQEGCFAGYASSQVVALVIREEIPQVTLEEYAQAVLEANGRTQLQTNRRGNYLWFEYTYDTGEQELYYLAACLNNEETGWVINFATPVENRTRYQQEFLTWADSVSLE